MGEQERKVFSTNGSIKLTGGTSGGQNVKTGGNGFGYAAGSTPSCTELHPLLFRRIEVLSVLVKAK
jgi:hypothetical protein